MKKTIFSLIIAATMSLSLSANAQDDNDGSLVLSFFGVAHDSVDQGGSNSTENKYNYGLGAFVEANVNDHLGIETGAMLVDKQYESSFAGARVVQETTRLHIPVMLKLWLTDYFSVAAGPFASVKLGDTSTTLNIANVDVASFSSSADEDVEFGYDLSATFNFAIRDKTGIFVEGRYSSLFDEESSEDADELYALVGFKLDL